MARDLVRPRPDLRLLLLAAVSPLLAAATPVVLMDQELRPQAVYLHLIRGEEIQHYSEPDRTLVTEPLSKYLRVTVRDGGERRARGGPDDSEMASRSWIVLTDGQRLTGVFMGGSEDGERVLWRHPLLGEVELSLDQVRVIDLGHEASGALGELASGGDVVLLANGDRLGGFIEGIVGEEIRLQLDDAARTVVKLTMDRVAAVRMGNPQTESAAADHRVTLMDDSRLYARALVVVADAMFLEPALGPTGLSVQVAMGQVRSVGLSSGGRRLEPLTELPRVVEGSAAAFTVAMPPYVEHDRLHLHAPVVLRFTLPDGAVRWAGRVSLAALEAQGAAAAWADCELVVRGDGRVLAHHRLNATQPVVWVNTPLETLDLILELREGLNGPVMDRVVIEEAAVLIETPGGR